MSRVDIVLIEDQQVLVTAQLDLTRTFGSAQAYHAASQTPQPMLNPAIASQLAAAANAIELMAGNVRVELVATKIVFEQRSLAEYLSPLAWPRATLTFTGALSTNMQPSDNGIRVRFDDTFVFEEPLATTIQSAADGAVKSRWLVTFQRSPLMQAPMWFGMPGLVASPSQDMSSGPVFVEYFSIGFWHIIPDGIDHLLFVLALVLAAYSMRSLLMILSLYTLAHSLSFAAAALGLLPPALLQVESLIILSIVVVALLNVRSNVASKGTASLALCFGLLHGLGFANALTESGLPTEQRLLSLLGFNLGVESAQLLWVLVLLPIWLSRNLPWFHRRVRQPVSLAIVGVALWWLF